MNADGRERARIAAAIALRELGLDAAALARRGGIDSATARDFLSGERWPRSTSQSKIEDGLGWPRGTIVAIEHGAQPPGVDEGPGYVSAPSDGGGDVGALSDDELARRILEATTYAAKLAEEQRKRMGRPS
jgi:hypothetical protein